MSNALTASMRRALAALLCAPALAASAVAALAMLSPAGCGSGEGRSDDELPGLVHAPRPTPDPIDVDRATNDLGELMRAAMLTHAQVGALLGAHTVTGRSHTEVHEKGAVIETIDDEIGIEFDSKGNFHAQLDNSKEYGRDVYFVDGWLYLRPRYGKFHRRRPNDDAEPARIRGEVYGTVAATLELLAPGIALSDGGALQVAGRKGRLINVSTLRQPRKPPLQALSQRKWRETAVVREVSGELVLDVKSGVLLRAALQGTLSFRRDARAFEMRLEARHELGTFAAVEDVEAPSAEMVVADSEQRHELDERDSLLEGIAPPTARGRGAGGPAGGEGP